MSTPQFKKHFLTKHEGTTMKNSNFGPHISSLNDIKWNTYDPEYDKNLRRKKLRANNLNQNQTSRSPYVRHRYYDFINPEDPSLDYLQSHGFVIDSWPWIDTGHHHNWGTDGVDHDKSSRSTHQGNWSVPEEYNYWRSRRPFWAFDNHAMRSQPEYYDPDGPANVRLMRGLIPDPFSDHWRTPYYHRNTVSPGAPAVVVSERVRCCASNTSLPRCTRGVHLP
jgi:hypothetical protein